VHEADYDTLIAALQDLLARLGAAGRKPGEFSVEICSAGELLIHQVPGTWQARDPRLRPRCNIARHLLQDFRGYRMMLWPRERVAGVLG
jgi:hypothetical protein